MSEKSPEFAGLAALVTGGASGIGLATARLPAARSALLDLIMKGLQFQETVNPS